MAFATANVKPNYFSGLNVTTGDWSGAVGDAPGTITVKGGRVYLVSFVSQDGTAPQQVATVIGVSQANATSTVTVNNNMAVTNGRFLIISA
jgi:hypothetical protein